MRGLISVAVIAATLAATPLQAQTHEAPVNQTYWTAGAGALHTQKWLGSADIRRGGHYFVTHNRPEPRFAFQNHPAAVSVMGYYTVHKGGGFFGQPFNALHAWGVLVTARYWNRDTRALPTFLEVGWGLHFGNRWIEDIDTPVASTPTLGLGILVEFGDTPVIFAARWMHVSNAGFGSRNRGQNGLIFSAEIKY